MNKFISLVLVFTLFVCATLPVQASSPLSPTQSEYLITLGGGFLLKSGKPMYAMTYEAVKPIPTDVVLRVAFENPEDPNSPLITEVKPDEGHILVRSELMNAIKNKKNYKVIVELIKDDQVISTHEQYVRFEMPDAALAKLGVKTL